MASRKDMPAIAFLDMHGETHEDRQYMKFKRLWRSPDEGAWDDHSLAEDLAEQVQAGRRVIAHYVPIY